MASAIARARKPVGSKEWIAEEKENCRQLVQQELDEVEFPVRHEMDWLNEHMAEIFTRDQLYGLYSCSSFTYVLRSCFPV